MVLRLGQDNRMNGNEQTQTSMTQDSKKEAPKQRRGEECSLLQWYHMWSCGNRSTVYEPTSHAALH
eukprot:5090346-Amphidinium_carterae.1